MDPETRELKELASVAPSLANTPIAQFYPGSALAESGTNAWGRNLACLRAMVEEAGFMAERAETLATRGIVVGRRTSDERKDFFSWHDRSTTNTQEQLQRHIRIQHGPASDD